jgi:putative ABC transport system substrate-binding protein
MRRREFVVGAIGAAALWPGGVRSQQATKALRIGFLGLTNQTAHAYRLESLRAGLRELGYVDGRNIAFEYRWAEGNYQRLPELAAELVRLDVAILMTHTVPGAQAARRATSTIPIVVTAVADLLATGLVESLSRPGGNITGLSFFNAELAAKRLELAKELVPGLTRAGVLVNPSNEAGSRLVNEELEKTAKLLNLDLAVFGARGVTDLEAVFAAMARQQVGALVVHEDPMLNANSARLAELAASHRIPICGFPELVRAGGLLAYGVNFPELERRAAIFVDRILKGARPGDLPVERATKFTLIVNLKAANAIGITVPTGILLRANEVIE